MSRVLFLLMLFIASRSPIISTTKSGDADITTGDVANDNLRLFTTTGSKDNPRLSTTTGSTDIPRLSITTGSTDKPRLSTTTGSTDIPRLSITTGSTDKPRLSTTTGSTDNPRLSTTTGSTDNPRPSTTTGSTDSPRLSTTTGSTDIPRLPTTTGSTDNPRLSTTTGSTSISTGSTDNPRLSTTTGSTDIPRLPTTTGSTDNPRLSTTAGSTSITTGPTDNPQLSTTTGSTSSTTGSTDNPRLSATTGSTSTTKDSTDNPRLSATTGSTSITTGSTDHRRLSTTTGSISTTTGSTGNPRLSATTGFTSTTTGSTDNTWLSATTGSTSITTGSTSTTTGSTSTTTGSTSITTGSTDNPRLSITTGSTSTTTGSSDNPPLSATRGCISTTTGSTSTTTGSTSTTTGSTDYMLLLCTTGSTSTTTGSTTTTTTTPARPSYKRPLPVADVEEIIRNSIVNDLLDTYTNMEQRAILFRQLTHCPHTSLCQLTVSDRLILFTSESCCTECSCDPSCVKTYNCCPDLVTLGTNELPLSDRDDITRPVCIPSYLKPNRKPPKAGDKGILAIAKCPFNSDPYIASLCIREYTVGTLSFPDIVPVTHTEGGVIYRNKFCAFCNNVDQHELVYWNVELNIFSASLMVSSETEAINLAVSNTAVELIYNSTVGPATPSCLPGVESGGCNITGRWTVYDDSIARACQFYDLPYRTDTDLYYENVFCAVCNGYDPDAATCHKDGSNERWPSFSVLLKTSSPVTETGTDTSMQCAAGYVEDKLKVTRSVAYFTKVP